MRQNLLVTLLFAGILGGCGRDPDPTPNPNDMATPDASTPDMSAPIDQGRDGSSPDLPTGGNALCEPCVDNTDCGGENDFCITYVEGEEASCGIDCDEDAPCPTGYFCAVLDEGAGVQQCVPEQLTCVDRCSDVDCAAGEVCDPVSGACRRPLRLCETGCVLNSLCGDGPEDLCLNVPGTSDGERACFTGCNPEAEEPECPADYFCAQIDPDNDPTRGVCFPFEGTCVDRCATVDCPGGQNCDPVTGQCSPSMFGACDPGCTNNAQCGGQDDICLNLGIGDGSHCWQDCTSSECPSGYDCRSLLGSTLRVCIPLGNDCSACYDNACFPDGVCDPIADTCESIAQTCASDADCTGGDLCDPVSTTCVAVGRPCNGSTWAVDCDNAVTKCTSQRAGVDGTCERLCTTDTDCPGALSCVATNLGSFCLGDDFGGGGTCGTLQRSTTSVGRVCNPGSCLSSAPVCVDGGNVNGFCADPCSSDANCTADQVCQIAAGTSTGHCIPANCRCAAAVASGPADAALENALTQLGLSQCDVVFEDASYAGLTGVLGLPGESAEVVARVRAPLSAPGRFDLDAERLDAATNVAEGLAAAAAINGLSLTPVVRNFTYAGTQGVLAQAIAELVTAAGDTPNLTALDAAVSGVPAAVQAAAAPLVSAVAVQVTARAALLAGLSSPQALFDDAPFVLLPATTQTPPDAQALGEGVQFANDLVESADFVGQIPDVANSLGALGSQTFSTVSIPTSAGRVVIADSGNHTHDLATHGDEIAVLIDLGGDDTYTVPAGANASVSNGVSVLLDLGGADTYGYDIVVDPNDGSLLPSDADGRIAPTLPLNQANGPVSASNTARQGAGRLGIGILVDLGSGTDSFDSLRMSQGAAVFGVGVLWDEGAANFRAEALAHGAAIAGVGAIFGGSGITTYTAWHAAQGFSALGGVGVAHDRGSSADVWTADPGSAGTVLYLSAADRGVSNRSLAQGAAFGEIGSFAGGVGLLRDQDGDDTYSAGTYAQGYAHGTAVAALLDGAGDDVFEARALCQGVGEWRGGGVLREAGGADTYNTLSTQRLVSHGVGQTLGWGIFLELGGDDDLTVLPSGGGVGLDGGFGLLIDAAGSDSHRSTSNATWGVAQINAVSGDPGFAAQTIGIFVDTGAMTDLYARPNLTGITDNGVWSPGPNPPTFAFGGDN